MIKKLLYKEIKWYITGLFRNFLPYVYTVLEKFKGDKDRIQSNVGFKEFVCMNILLNLRSFAHAIVKHLYEKKY